MITLVAFARHALASPGTPGTEQRRAPLPQRSPRRLAGKELQEALDRLSPKPALEDYEPDAPAPDAEPAAPRTPPTKEPTRG